MKTEIERKFLVAGDGFRSEAVGCHSLAQGYICRESGRTVRVRIDDGRGWLTIKGISTVDGTMRGEWEYEIPVDDARAMLSLCIGKIIEKDRYIIPAVIESLDAQCLQGKSDRQGLGGEEKVCGHKETCGQEERPLVWEVDVFHGAHEGLVLAEIELEYAEQNFVRPVWLGEEVTGDRRYYNSVLSADLISE